MHRFFIAPENIRDCNIFIDKEQSWHIEKVLRLSAGNIVIFFDGTGKEYQVKLGEKENGLLTGEIISESFRKSEPELKLYLAQGIAKGEKMDTIIQKAVEIGIKAIYPISCERSVVRLDGEKANKRVQRWQSIAREACKQCRRNVLPEVMPVMDFSSLLAKIKERPALMLYEKENNNLRYLLQEKEYSQAEEIFVIIGPEGGISDKEAASAAQHGVNTASLGPRILRTETAGLVAASIILYEYGDLG